MSKAEHFGPVETEGAEEIRQYALAKMKAEYDYLVARTENRWMSQIERKMIAAYLRSILNLERQAPVGPLLPPYTDNPDLWRERNAKRARQGDPPPETAGETYCMECDARQGECEHTGRRYLPAARYNEVSDPGSLRKMWGVPSWERDRFHNPPSRWPKPEAE